MRLYPLVTALCLLGSAADAAKRFTYEFEELASGVWTGVRPDSPRFPVMGNATFVVSDVGVVVYDGGGLPVMADQVIDKIRSVTRRPVTHIVISHWHGDHHFGIHRYVAAFPNVQVVAHAFTDRAMRGSTIDYVDGYPTFVETRFPRFRAAVQSGRHADGTPVSEHDRAAYLDILSEPELIGREFGRARVTLPTLVFRNELTIRSGERSIELRYLGDGNTAGDIVMWLPRERIVATGDLVVLPSPYAFNVPPRRWAETLRRLNALGYETLVPGHGPVQHDQRYVDLVVAVADDIADQRDAMVADGVATEDIAERLDFSAWREQFTKGDAYLEGYYEGWFEQPLRAAAVKELSGEPMVVIGPRGTRE